MEKIIKLGTDPVPLDSFKKARIDEGGEFRATTYLDFVNPEKNSYKKVLLEEQFYLCAYCNKLLSEENLHHLKIEHWYPQSLCKKDANYKTINAADILHSNMLLVCNGESVNPKYRHCDSSRTPKKMLTIKPQDSGYSFDLFLRYEGGKLISSDHDINIDIKELNLNHEDLMYKRRIVLDQFRKILLSLNRNSINKVALLKKYSNPNSEGRKAQYCTLILNEIKKIK
ncbi:HNH endonuclease family protein [Flavobacterium hibernum]|uniref:TIGR02646 family protein n=1 Tax=Flavobacterium hibernum TaxID=37752 RepID=A0A0D0ET16_9FLAO|nr:hypothetical protein [Flavobacterium hibernum]KIO51603.1 hypothetical protein IW18_16800 [Flavobacterium hibernum]OXA86308.1 hypothetical protein B0A73_14295 [Flavobacterium hibernum]STO11248.1 Uncharacterised protein [Flavobacterium hibernum]